MDNTRGFRMAFAGVYLHHIAKVEKKGRTKEAVQAIIHWLTVIKIPSQETGSAFGSPPLSTFFLPHPQPLTLFGAAASGGRPLRSYQSLCFPNTGAAAHKELPNEPKGA